MRKLITSIAIIPLFLSNLYASDLEQPLSIEVADIQVRITVPNIPKIEMAVHPMHEHKPYFRLRGSNGKTSLSIITPKIEGADSPMACARAIANSIIAQDNVIREQVFLGKANENTLLIIYGLPMERSVLLNTHIISLGMQGCVEAHVSKISTSDEDIEPWFNGFGDANIEKI